MNKIKELVLDKKEIVFQDKNGRSAFFKIWICEQQTGVKETDGQHIANVYCDLTTGGGTIYKNQDCFKNLQPKPFQKEFIKLCKKFHKQSVTECEKKQIMKELQYIKTMIAKEKEDADILNSVLC